MRDIDKAKLILVDGGYTCVLCKGDLVYTSTERGVRPVLDWLSDGIDMKGFSVADKIVGKAAALLFVLAGITEIYAPIMSRGAVSVFSLNGIKYEASTITDYIVNRQGNGQCPMEMTVDSISDPRIAYVALMKKSEELRKLAK